MKILVDKLPTSPRECPFSEMRFAPEGFPEKLWKDICGMDKNSISECEIGEDYFECPYFREFKAKSVETLRPDGRVQKIVPVEFKE